jgi:hypothetical protein
MSRLSCRYSPGGVAEEAFYIQLLNAAAPNIIALLHLPQSLDRFVFSHFARSQQACDELMEPHPMELPLRTANVVRTVAITIIYTPILPISPIIGAIAVALSCASRTLVNFIVLVCSVLRCQEEQPWRAHVRPP